MSVPARTVCDVGVANMGEDDVRLDIPPPNIDIAAPPKIDIVEPNELEVDEPMELEFDELLPLASECTDGATRAPTLELDELLLFLLLPNA